MKANAKEIFRWVGTAIGLGMGTWILSGVWSELFRRLKTGSFDWVDYLLPLLLVVIFSVPFFLLAYLSWSRRLREVATAYNFVAALMVYGVVGHWLRPWAPWERDDPTWRNAGLLSIYFDLGLAAICTGVPFLAAYWFYKFCQVRIDRWFPRSALAAVMPGRDLTQVDGDLRAP